MNEASGLLPGTLDLLILKAVSLGKLHGYGVLLRIQQISGGALQIQQGALYPGALPARTAGADRERVGHVRQQPAGEVLSPDRGRAARGSGEEAASWNRLADAIAMALRTTRQEI